ncbi:hypothetical protein CIB95_12580 [Lottiidibacillus patelloidae]|uniref:CRISPR type III-associated protein domain-containing protein n=1 Tax=Lottiidibacillus patelloidae TaxID=2670334 RepID=A0A263BRB8_9BACI|nr:RAMP superfamily CRISPR-associated protein [Lottiidibacillus patelloidae]OZM56253.1 hypothetical protein CIB95_12580 [Lottiidibacillus patelloidae]
MANIMIEYNVNLQSMLHVGTGEGFAGIIDRKTLSRIKENERYPIVFGHTVKGMLRDEYRKLLSLTGNSSLDIVESLFGSEKKQGGLYFSHWELNDEIKENLRDKANMLYEVKSGNQIVRGRRVAKSEHLYTHEVVQNNLVFKGIINGIIKEEITLNGIPKPIYYLLLSLYSLKRVGGRRRAGLGHLSLLIKKVEIDGKLFSERQINQLLENNIANLVEEVVNNG